MEDVPTGNAAAATAAAVSEAASRAAQVASREAIDAVYRMWIPNGQNSVECHRVARFAIACGLSVCLSVEKIIHILAAIIVDDSLRVSSQMLVREIEYAETARPHTHTAIVRAYSFSMTLGYQRVNGAVLPTSMFHHGPSKPLVKPVEYSAFALNNVRAYSIYNMGCIILATTDHQYGYSP